MAVPPDLVAFAQAAGPSSIVAYGPDSARHMNAELVRKWHQVRNPITVLRQARDHLTADWAAMSAALMAIADGADVIVSGMTFEDLAANVAEAHGIPLAALHYFPLRTNHLILPIWLPMVLLSPLWVVAETVYWRLVRPAEDAQRRTLGLPASRTRSVRRILDSGALELQAYDSVLFPGLATRWGARRPIIGALSLERATPADQPVKAWIAKGPPPIYFGFGSTLIDDPDGMVDTIIALCKDLGQRALIHTGGAAREGVVLNSDIMIVPAINYAEMFPLCRAVVHHGGAGTTAAGLRAGMPTLVLWSIADQPLWARQVKRLGVGTGRRLSTTTPETLREDLLKVLEPGCRARAQAIARQMTQPRQNVTDAADRIEGFVSGSRTC
jgi:UDP:flavonoid glycosyltransferase YjiC (YdhE family)